jgi:hypothetical protein
MPFELSVGALIGVAIGLAVDLFKKKYELRLALQRDVRELVGEASSGIAKMVHAVLWVTYRATQKNVEEEARQYNAEMHQLIGSTVATQVKLAHMSPESFQRITPWITRAIRLSESADEAIANLSNHRAGASDSVATVNSDAMALLKAFQKDMLRGGAPADEASAA